MLIYYLPLATGFAKSFGTPYDSFWCCYGTGIESFSKLGDSIYFHDGSDVYVNLFVGSEVRWPEKGLRLQQLTRFPEQEGTSFVFHTAAPTTLGLRVHVPYWATRGVEVKVNGLRQKVTARPTSYLRLARQWRDGDRVDISMPMGLRTQAMRDDPEKVAVMYGPVVLAGITDKARWFLGDPAKPEGWVKPVPGKPLTFTVGTDPAMTLVPLNRILHERYGVYWVVTPEGSPRHKRILADEEARRKREARIVDHVVPNNAESEKAHNIQGENHGSGDLGGMGGWHHAISGWFSWDLKVLPDVPMTLVCTFWGSDSGNRTFDILVEGQKMGTMTLSNNRPGELFEVEYPLAPESIKGKTKITVRFQSHPDNFAGGCFGCATLKPE
jgi:hypothetical protein